MPISTFFSRLRDAGRRPRGTGRWPRVMSTAHRRASAAEGGGPAGPSAALAACGVNPRRTAAPVGTAGGAA